MKNIVIELAKTEGISDIHLSSNKPIALRIDGLVHKREDQVAKNDDIRKFLEEVLDKEILATLKAEKNADFSISLENFRLRGNAYFSQDGINVVLRILQENAMKFDEINFPPVVRELLEKKNGLILVTGQTGSGKSTSLAAMIDYLNTNHQKKIITIEDPIEYLHAENNSIISQREIGSHATTFSSALKAALREDPDIILVGELRDLETIQLALTAAETGHLVLATLHTSGAPNTINRIIDVFPSGQQAQVRAQLALSLNAAITQRLLLRTDGNGRVPAFEIMISNPAIQNLIREDKVFQIPTIMQTGAADGMVLMDKSIELLRSDGVINYDAT
tara:strand:- start:139 stop:1140 length:1002 start_codon:yes stop_codon:yes gene_type:complete